jgi:hypothetical protein
MNSRGLLRRVPLKWLLVAITLIFRVREVITDKQKKIFRDLWTEAWLSEGYAHLDDLPEVEKHYAVFDRYSTDLLVCFLIWPIGTMRLIWDNQEIGMPFLNDFEHTAPFRRPVVEFTLVCLKPGWRNLNSLPSLVAWREGYRQAVARGMAEIGLSADRRLFHLIRRIFPFRKVGPEKFYEGSITIPNSLDLDIAYRVLARKNPQLFQFFVSNEKEPR